MAKILVADDDASSLEVISLALSGEGHDVVSAGNGQEAYELAQSEQPDLVFLDIMMPIYNGYETCQLIRNDPSIPATLPIVFLTSLDSDKRMMEKVGATDFLPKRHMVVELRDLLVKHLGPLAMPGPAS